MAIPAIPPKVEVLVDGSWFDLTQWLDTETTYSGNRSQTEDRKPTISSFSFSLDNALGEWTEGNTSSAQYGKLRQYARVRFSSRVSSTTRYHFSGVITDLKRNFLGANSMAKHRVQVSCEGLELMLSLPRSYQGPSTGTYPAIASFTYLQDVDIDDAMVAIMTAVGVTDYSFEDSSVVLPYFLMRGSPLSDWLEVGDSELGGERWFDGQGRPRLKKAENMVGGYGSPTHAWGTTIAPEGEVVPIHRLDARFATIEMAVVEAKPALTRELVWKYSDYFAPEKIAPYAERRFTGRVERPVFRFETVGGTGTSGTFIDTGDTLWAPIDASVTQITTSSAFERPIGIAEGDQIKIDTEVMQVTQVVSMGSYRAVLNVVRGALGTPAAPHTAGSGPSAKKIFRRELTLSSNDYVYFGVTSAPVGSSSSAPALASQPAGATASLRFEGPLPPTGTGIGDLIQVGSELLGLLAAPVSVGGGFFTVSVVRGARGTTSAAIDRGRQIRLLAPQWDQTGGTSVQTGTGNVLSSLSASGSGAAKGYVVMVPAFTDGRVLRYDGQDFEFRVYNQTPQDRWITEAEVWADVFTISESPNHPMLTEAQNALNAAKQYSIRMQRAIPGVAGLPEGPSLSLPYGLPDVAAAKTYLAAKLQAGRAPAPWLRATFHANVDAHQSSILSADIGDLVLYSATGTYSERITEWYRVSGISFEVDGTGENWLFTFILRPAHENVLPSKSWFTTFTWQGTTGSTGLGVFDAAPPGDGGWPAASQWKMYQPISSDPVRMESWVSAPGVAAPTAALKNIGDADMRVAAGTTIGPIADRVYSGDTHGVGVHFRANSADTQYWWAFFQPSTDEVILGNSTDGVVARKAFAIANGDTPEISVLAIQNSIRVYVEARPEPIISVTSTRFQTNTYAAPQLASASIATTGTRFPGLRWFSAQVV